MECHWFDRKLCVKLVFFISLLLSPRQLQPNNKYSGRAFIQWGNVHTIVELRYQWLHEEFQSKRYASQFAWSNVSNIWQCASYQRFSREHLLSGTAPMQYGYCENLQHILRLHWGMIIIFRYFLHSTILGSASSSCSSSSLFPRSQHKSARLFLHLHFVCDQS